MKTWKKRIFLAAILSLLITLGIYLAWVGTSREEQAAVSERPPLPVTVMELTPRDFVLTSLYNGKLEAVSDVTVVCRVRGTVIDDRIREGQRVSKGQVLYKLDDDSYRFAMLQAEAGVELARENLRKVENISRPEEIRRLEALAGEAHASLEKARADARRYDELYREGAVSLSQKESVDLALSAAEAGAEVADENLKQARSGARDEDIAQARSSVAQAVAGYELSKDVWEDATILSPIRGIVSSKEVFEGDTLEVGMSVCNIVDLSAFKINLGVPASEIGDVNVGEIVSVSTVIDEEIYEAVIEDVGVKADDGTGTFPVILRLDNPEVGDTPVSLRAGMDVKVHLIREKVPDALVIPTSAFLREIGIKAVYVIDDGIAVRKVVATGPGDEMEAVVSAGLKAGELLVIVGHHRLWTGDRVETALAR